MFTHDCVDSGGGLDGRGAELRVYNANEGKLDDLLKRFREHTMRLFEKHGMKNVAYWDSARRSIEGQDADLHPCSSQPGGGGQQLKAFGDDPEWQKVRGASEVNGKLVDKVDSTFMVLTDFSRPCDRTSPPSTNRWRWVLFIDGDYHCREGSLIHKRVVCSNAVLFVSLFVCSFISPAFAQVETWKIDPAHSSAQFAVRHLGISTVRGEFRKVSGSATYDPADPSKTSLEATIDATTVDTRVDMRDNDLRSPNFLDVQKYPTITFKSKRAESAGPGKMKIAGDLTIHGVTKEVVLDVDGPSAPVKDPKGNFHVGASASTTINRKDFGVNGAPSMVSDQISITIDAELVKNSPAPQ